MSDSKRLQEASASKRMTLSPMEMKALHAEIRADERAARVRDFGEADAATYDQRVRDGGNSVRHLEPDPSPTNPAEVEKAIAAIEESRYDDFLSDTSDRAMFRAQGKELER